MKFESLFKYVEEGFPSNGTQTSRGPEGGGAGVVMETKQPIPA